MSSPSKLMQFFALVAFCLMMGTGQILFKLASVQAKGAQDLAQMVRLVCLSPYFWAAGMLYAVASMLWVMILTRIPMTVAYPASALTLVLVTVFAWWYFGDTMNTRIVIGMALILSGIWLLATR